ncbi:MAG: MFS transporter [Candidatus Latescibacteria bacterium]|nr:MFS transporter [Candidatus Latescibacterota bacterium]
MTNPGPKPRFTRLQTLRGMRLWNVRGAFSAVHSSITTGAYTTGYALHLGASNAIIGLLSAAASWGALLQVFSPLLIERLPRRKTLCLLAFGFSFAIWLPVALLPSFISREWLPMAMVICIVIGGLASSVAAPANSSWLTDLVPADVRGRFVSRQQSIIAAVGLVVSLAAGAYLDLFEATDPQMGFTSLFIIAVVFGMVAIFVWSRIPEPPSQRMALQPAKVLLTLPFKHRQFRTFMMLVSVRGMLAMVAAPFFAVYMLQTLMIPYSEIALFAALQILVRVAFNPLWGYLGDKFGYRPVLLICSAGLAVFPLGWVFATHENYMIAVPLIQAWGGLVSAGIPTARFNLMAKIAPKENRSIYIGCYSAMFNTGSAIGAMVGGVLATFCMDIGSYQIYGYTISGLQYLFLIGFVLRLISVVLLRLIREEASTSPRVVLRQVSRGRPLATLWHLIRMVKSNDPEVKARAARELGETGSALAVEELIDLLDDSDRHVREEAARSLGNIGDRRAVTPLLDKISDPYSDIAHEAIQALGAVRTPLSLNILVTLLGDERTDIRRSAVQALDRLGDERMRPALSQVLETETDRAIALATVEALSKLEADEILPRIYDLMRDSTPGFERKALAQALGHLMDTQDRLYRMLEAEPMIQDRQVAVVFSAMKRLLSRWEMNKTLDAPYFETQLTDALSSYEDQDFGHAAGLLHDVTQRAIERMSASPKGVSILASYSDELDKDFPDEGLHLLLHTGTRAFKISGLIVNSMNEERRQRELHLEEFLVCVIAFRQMMTEILRMGKN